MRIVIDLQSCQSGSSLGGIGRYSLELAKAMVTNSSADEFVVVLNNRNQASKPLSAFLRYQLAAPSFTRTR
jgi:hypothetical protein